MVIDLQYSSCPELLIAACSLPILEKKIIIKDRCCTLTGGNTTLRFYHNCISQEYATCRVTAPSLFHAISILPGKLLSPGSSVLYSLFRFLSAVSIHHPAYFFRLSGAEKTVWKLSCWRRRNTNTGIRRLKKGMHPHWADRGNAQHEAIRRYYIRRLSPLTL